MLILFNVNIIYFFFLKLGSIIIAFLLNFKRQMKNVFEVRWHFSFLFLNLQIISKNQNMHASNITFNAPKNRAFEKSALQKLFRIKSRFFLMFFFSRFPFIDFKRNEKEN